MYDEEEVPNAKCMCVVEEEVSLLWSYQRKRRSEPPPSCRGPFRRKGMPCLGTALGKFFVLLFFSKTQEILLAFFS
jgi:hypothetical protein